MIYQLEIGQLIQFRQMISTYEHEYKIVLVGDEGVGKSSIIKRFIDETYQQIFLKTIGVTFIHRTINISGKKTKLSLYDLSGQQKFHSIAPCIYHHSHALILCFDVTNSQSFQNVCNYWFKQLQNHNRSHCSIFIMGNKIDILDQKVQEKRVQQFAKNNNISKIYYVSAKENLNIQESFKDIAVILSYTPRIESIHEEQISCTLKLRTLTRKMPQTLISIPNIQASVISSLNQSQSLISVGYIEAIKVQFYQEYISMKIQRKTLVKFEIGNRTVEDKTSEYFYPKYERNNDQELSTMFGLPRSLVESPKLGKLKQMIHNKKINKQNNLSYEEMGPAGKYLHFNLKNTVMNRTNLRFRSLRKHNSLFETYTSDQGYGQDKKTKIQANNNLTTIEHSSKNTLDVLQKIIFKQGDFQHKKIQKMSLHANKLPIIENNSLKRKQSMGFCLSKQLISNLLNRQKPSLSKPSPRFNKIQKPFLSGWETEEGQW